MGCFEISPFSFSSFACLNIRLPVISRYYLMIEGVLDVRRQTEQDNKQYVSIHLGFPPHGKSNLNYGMKDTPLCARLSLVSKEKKTTHPNFQCGFNLFISYLPNLIPNNSNGRKGIMIEHKDRALWYANAPSSPSQKTHVDFSTRYHPQEFDPTLKPAYISFRVDPSKVYESSFSSPLLVYHYKSDAQVQSKAKSKENSKEWKRKEYWGYLKIKMTISYILSITWPRAAFEQYVRPLLLSHQFVLSFYRQSNQNLQYSRGELLETLVLTDVRQPLKADGLPTTKELLLTTLPCISSSSSSSSLSSSSEFFPTYPVFEKKRHKEEEEKKEEKNMPTNLPDVSGLSLYSSEPTPDMLDCSSYLLLPTSSLRTRLMIRRYT